MPTFTFDITGNFVASAPGTLTIEADTYEEAARKAAKDWRSIELDFDLDQVDVGGGLCELDISDVRKEGGAPVDFCWSSEQGDLCDWDLASVRQADQAEVSA